MEMFWMFLLPLLCSLPCLTWSEKTGTCNSKLKIIRVNLGDSVTVPCPSDTREHATFHLYKENKVIYSFKYSNRATENTSSHAVELWESKDNQSIGFKFAAGGCGPHIYRCESEVVFPPPVKTLQHEKILLVFTELTTGTEPTSAPEVSGEWFHWSWIVALICGIYGIILTIAVVVIQVKRRNAECQNDYINTKPKPSKERRKKKGVQNPAPWYC